MLWKEYIDKMPDVPGRSSTDLSKPLPPSIVSMNDMINDLKCVGAERDTLQDDDTEVQDIEVSQDQCPTIDVTFE